MITPTKFEQAKTDPTLVFERPGDVLNDTTLTREQKIDILRRWEYDERELSVAEEENMPNRNNGKRTGCLEEILRALRALNAEGRDPHSASTKQG